MYYPDVMAEYIKGWVRINKNEKSSDKELIGVIAHEVGHFFELEHNNEKDSVMNIKLPLETLPSEKDIKRAAKNLHSETFSPGAF
jgi:predicted Zn-dependent protease